jgi:hypothetical protein
MTAAKRMLATGHLPQRAGLRLTNSIEINIDLSLNTLFGIPGGFTMPDQAESGDVC